MTLLARFVVSVASIHLNDFFAALPSGAAVCIESMKTISPDGANECSEA